MPVLSEPLTYGFVTADHIMLLASYKGKWYALGAPLQLARSMIVIDPHKTRCKQGTQKARTLKIKERKGAYDLRKRALPSVKLQNLESTVWERLEKFKQI